MTTPTRVNLRELAVTDVARVVELTRTTGVFRDEEIAIAEEVVTEAVKADRSDVVDGNDRPDRLDRPDRPYYALGAEVDGRVVGSAGRHALPSRPGISIGWRWIRKCGQGGDRAARGDGVASATRRGSL
jgi:hypothetical protein